MINHEKIRELRHRHKLTQAKLADKVGCSKAFISQLENGHAWGSTTTLAKLSKALNCSADELLARIDRE